MPHGHVGHSNIVLGIGLPRRALPLGAFALGRWVLGMSNDIRHSSLFPFDSYFIFIQQRRDSNAQN
jgi:hypothetical protein